MLGGLTVKTREPDQKPPEADESNADVVACAHDLLAAIASNDAKRVASVLEDLFECLKSRPESDESYDSLNEKAAE